MARKIALILPSSTSTATSAILRGTMQVQIHRLAADEKLSDVARSYGCSTSDIVLLNPHKESFHAPGVGSLFTSLEEHEPIYVPTGLGEPAKSSVVVDNPSLCPIGATADANADADGITVNVTCNCPPGMTINIFNEAKNLAGIKAGACVAGNAPTPSPSDCPTVTSSAGPAGVIPYCKLGAYGCRTLCKPKSTDKINLINLCNTSFDPESCYFAKAFNLSAKNRVPAPAIKAWRAWGPGNPTGDPSKNPDGTSHNSGDNNGNSGNGGGGGGNSGGGGGSSGGNTALYVGLGVVALISLGFIMRPKK